MSATTHHIGLQAFTEVCTQFKAFAKSIPVPTKHCKHMITGGNNPLVNYVYDIDFTDLDGLAHDLQALQNTAIPMMLLCESQDASALGDYFTKNRLTYIGVAQSKQLDLRDFSYQPNPMITIVPVDTPARLHTWREIAATSFGYPLGCDDALFSAFLKNGEHHEYIKFFIAMIDGQAAGQCMLVMGENITANMWSSVLPAFRNRGILTEMAYYRNALAKQRGYALSVVQCMPSSDSAYTRMGYQNAEKLSLYTLNT